MSEMRQSSRSAATTTIYNLRPSTAATVRSVPAKKLDRAIGTSTVIGTTKAAKDLTRKAIFCISNVDNDVSCDEMTNHLKHMSINAISVFEAKT